MRVAPVRTEAGLCGNRQHAVNDDLECAATAAAISTVAAVRTSATVTAATPSSTATTAAARENLGITWRYVGATAAAATAPGSASATSAAAATAAAGPTSTTAAGRNGSARENCSNIVAGSCVPTA